MPNSSLARSISVVVLVSTLGGVALEHAPEARAHRPVLLSAKGTPLGDPYRRWVRKALVPVVGGRLRVYLTGCPGKPKAAGCVFYRHPRRVYLKRSARGLAGVFYHELGHLFDFRVLNDRDRRQFRRLMGQQGRRWAWSGRNPPAELFAEAYSWCARFGEIRSIGRFATYGYDPSPRQHRAACLLIRRAARDESAPRKPSSPPAVTEPHPPPPPPQPPATQEQQDRVPDDGEAPQREPFAELVPLAR